MSSPASTSSLLSSSSSSSFPSKALTSSGSATPAAALPPASLSVEDRLKFVEEELRTEKQKNRLLSDELRRMKDEAVHVQARIEQGSFTACRFDASPIYIYIYFWMLVDEKPCSFF